MTRYLMPSPLLPRLRTALDRFFRRPAVDAVVMGLVLISVALLLIEFYGLARGEASVIVVTAGHAITGVFIIELSLRWFAAPSTRAHWREYWLDWLSVVPVFRPIRALRAIRFLRALRLLRLYRFGLLAHRFAGTFEPRHLEAGVREAVAHYAGRYAEHVRLAPDLLRMLFNLLDDGRVHNEARAQICQAVAYFVTPFEILPRDVHGAEGYLDQVYLCLLVVARLRGELPEHLLETAWEGEGDVESLVTETLPEIGQALPKADVDRVLRYVGLPEAAGAPLQ